MIREHGPQNFDAEGPFSVIAGVPWISDSNMVKWMKDRLRTGQRVRVTVEVLDEDERYGEIYKRIKGNAHS